MARSSSGSGQFACQEIADVTSDFRAVRLEREVAGVQQMHFGIGNIFLVGQRTRRDEGRIILAPYRQQRWLMLTKILVEGRVGGDVVAVVVDQVKLDFVRARSCQIGNVQLV